MEDRDILVFTDEEDQEIQLEILDYFEYDDEEYVLLAEAYEDDEDDDHDHNHDHDHDCDSCSCGDEEKNIYIMKVVMDGDEETFVPVEEDKMEELIGAVENLYTNDEFDDEE